MKKIALVGLLSLFTLTGCSFDIDFGSFGQTGGGSNGGGGEKTPVPDPGTPTWWIEMFTCENVTIKITSKINATRYSYYKYVDGKYYERTEDGTEYVPAYNPDYDMLLEYRMSYLTFNMQETDTTCSCEDWEKFEGNAWRYSATIYATETHQLYKIVESSYLNSLTIVDTIVFFDWGTTTI